MTNRALITRRKSTDLAALTAKVKDYAGQAQAPNTRRAYSHAWQEFSQWTTDQGAAPLPASPGLVAHYLADLAGAGAKVSTIEVRRAAIGAAHRTAQQPDPTRTEEVKLVMKGIRQEHGQPRQKKAAITTDELRAIVAALPDDLAGKRDRALILLGFAGAFRRSELVALDVADLHHGKSLKITIRRSKTDQAGEGRTKVIPHVQTAELDAIAAVRAWLQAAGIKSGAIFRRIDRWGNLRAERLAPQAVATILKRAAEGAGLEPRQFAGHSLRSGFVTSAYEAGARTPDIMQQTGHQSENTLRSYIQNAGAGAQRAVLAAINGTTHPDDDKS